MPKVADPFDYESKLFKFLGLAWIKLPFSSLIMPSSTPPCVFMIPYFGACSTLLAPMEDPSVLALGCSMLPP
jgi:hypothetical protein